MSFLKTKRETLRGSFYGVGLFSRKTLLWLCQASGNKNATVSGVEKVFLLRLVLRFIN